MVACWSHNVKVPILNPKELVLPFLWVKEKATSRDTICYAGYLKTLTMTLYKRDKCVLLEIQTKDISKNTEVH